VSGSCVLQKVGVLDMSGPAKRSQPKHSDDWDYPYVNTPGALGSHHGISSEACEKDIIERLHDVVEEVTRKPVIRVVRKIGFY